MYQLSDCDSTDSEDGIRFKTDSTRHKDKNKHGRRKHDSGRHGSRERGASKRRRSRSPHHRRERDRKRDDRNREVHRNSSRSSSPKHRSKRRDKRKDPDKREADSSHKGELQTGETVSFGPALPPHLMNSSPPDKSESKTTSPDNPRSDFNLDTLQRSDVLEPKLPPNHLNNSTLETKLNSAGEVAAIGLELPSSHQGNESKNIGPILPPELRKKLAEEADKKEDDDDDVYGPVPVDVIKNSEAHVALEERALQMKIDQLIPTAPAKINREEWMTELPRVCASNLGLGPRQFRANPRPDLSDRSSWTDTPEDKAKKLTGKVEVKVDLDKERELQETQRRDEEQDAAIRAHKKHKKKQKSLLQLHQDKLKRNKEDGAEGSTRRPFDREIDLKVNRFDDAQKKAVLKKAQLLDSRFCQGHSKFL